jgi:hypothetical protein
MSRLGLVIILSILVSKTAYADFSHYLCTGPTTGDVRAISDDSACRGFRIGKREVLFSRIASGHLLVSKDGHTAVMIEDYLPGRIHGKTVEAEYDLDTITNPTVHVVYRDGKRVACHDIAKLAGDVTKLSESISHVKWIATMPDVLDNKRFQITTTSKRELVFDTVTGALVEERAATTP